MIAANDVAASYYRIRPVLGPASGSVELAMPARKGTRAVATAPVRDSASAPTDLAVEVAAPDRLELGWTDNSGDEEVAAYRVRAFRTGPASNIAHQTTGGS